MKPAKNKTKRQHKSERASERIPTEKKASTPTVPARHKWFFRITALVIAPLVLILLAAILEVGLRLGGCGYDPSFFRPIEIKGQKYFINNENFSRRFFPEQLARWPDPFKVPAIKAPETVRIFIFGESAAMGDPQPSYGASRYLEVLLRDRFPNKKFEVINLGITAINSHVILPIARESARHEGDIWIVYMGNNEMVGPFGAATVFGAQALPRRAAQFNLAVQTTRIGQLLVAAQRKLGGKTKNTSWGGMEMFLENRIQPDDPRKATVYENFAANLNDIVRAGIISGAQVILSTVAVNLKDCPPFASLAGANLSAAERKRFDQLLDEAKALQNRGDFLAVSKRLEEAVKIDPGFAEAQFRLAQCELAMANASARDHFQIACDVDALPFRADTKINDIIRQTASQFSGDQLVLCDAERFLAQSSPRGIAGDELLFEHVHFNPEGNYELGKLWAEQVAPMIVTGGTKVTTNSWASKQSCDEALGLTIWNRHFLLQSAMRRMNTPPLSTQPNNAARLQALNAQDIALRSQQAQPGAAQKVREDFLAALKRAPDDRYLYEGQANFLEAIKDPAGAIAAYRMMLEILPEHYYACLQLGRLLGEQGQAQEGELFLTQAARMRPNLPDAWFELGNIMVAQSKFIPALEYFNTAMRLRPQDASYVCAYAQMLGHLNRHDEAIASLEQAIRLLPDYWEAHFELAGQYMARNQPELALAEYRTTLKINPLHVVAHINLGVVHVRFGQLDEAIKCFQDALRIDPRNRTAQEYLTSVQAHRQR